MTGSSPHYHNPRTVAETTPPVRRLVFNLGITGPAYTIGAACAAPATWA